MLSPKRSVLFFLLALASLESVAQKVKLQGYVRDEKEQPIASAAIREKGTRNGIAANREGFFSLSVTLPATLVSNCVGYSPAEKKIDMQYAKDSADRVIIILKYIEPRFAVTTLTVCDGVNMRRLDALQRQKIWPRKKKTGKARE